MGVLTNALNVVAANMTGSALPTQTAIGGSELAFASGQTALGTELDRRPIDFSDLTADEEVTFNTTFNPTEVSGLVIREFGTATTGSTFLNREVITGSVVPTGEEELTIQQTFKFYI